MSRILKLRGLLLSAFLLIALIVFGVGFQGYRSMVTMDGEARRIVDASVRIDAAMEAKYVIAREMQMIMEMIASRTAVELEAAWESHTTNAEEFDRSCELLLNGGETGHGAVPPSSDADLRKLVEEADALHNGEFSPRMDNLHSLVQRRNAHRQSLEERGEAVHADLTFIQFEQAIEGLDTEADAVGERIASLTDRIEAHVTENIDGAVTRFGEVSSSATTTATVGIVGGLVLALVLGIGIAQYISRPLGRVSEVAAAIATGDLGHDVDIHRGDEIGELAEAFRRMRDSLHDKVQVAEAIAGGDLNVTIEVASDADALGKAMFTMRDRLREQQANLKVALDEAYVKIEYLNNLSLPIHVVDKDMNVQYINPVGAQVAGKTQEECLGRKCYDLFRNPHCQTERCAVGCAMRGGQSRTDQTSVTLGGNTMHIRYTGTPIRNSAGEVIGAMEQIVDITSINTVIEAVNDTAARLKDGALTERIRVENLDKDYESLVDGFNGAMDNILAPVNEAVGCLARMAEGDLTTRMIGQYRGDHARMKNALNNTLDTFSEILEQVASVTESVGTGSAQVADSSNSLSEGATEQASSLEEISASLQEITSQAQNNSSGAAQANKLAGEARGAADRGHQRMGAMLKAMGEIQSSSGEISRIIRVIDEIAFQTNLLALNAAVEAARAGVHGKGFAVVAEEVRNLAQRAAKAAGETTGLIEGSVASVESGHNMARETAAALDDIVTAIGRVTDLVGEIDVASAHQSQGIEQINEGLVQMDQVTQSNTSNAEETAAAAKELSSLAAGLRQQIARFRLRGSESARSPQVANGGAVSVRKAPARPQNGPAGNREPVPAFELDDMEFGEF